MLICRLSKGTYAYGSGRPACRVQRATQERNLRREGVGKRASKRASEREPTRGQAGERSCASEVHGAKQIANTEGAYTNTNMTAKTQT